VKCHTGPQIWTDAFKQNEQWHMDLRFGTWNVRSLYRTGSLETVESKLAKYNLDVMAVQDVRQGQGW